jgi:hypothetical protein
MKKNVDIYFKLINNKWIFEIVQGDYRFVSGAKELKEAEEIAYNKLNKMNNVGTIHSTYVPGKHTPASMGKMPDNFQEPLTDQVVI